MATETTPTPRPRRADAQRNYDKLVSAARDVFAEQGTDASLERIAEHAGVGIGTLYRNFPSRQALLEAVYIVQAEQIAEFAEGLSGLEPWEALSAWLHEYVGFAKSKRALADELFNYVDRDDQVFKQCGTTIVGAGEPLLKRAQEAGVARPDAEFLDVGRMIGGIANVSGVDDEQIGRMVDLAIDGLRYTPQQ